MGRFTSYTEIFDFENKKILGKKTSELIRYKSFNIKPSFVSLVILFCPIPNCPNELSPRVYTIPACVKNKQ